MFNLTFSIPTAVNYGLDTEEKVGALMKPFASKVMIVYGSERIYKNGLGDKIEESLKSEGIESIRFGGVKPNGDTNFVDEAITKARESEVDGIIAIGGGSVIDTAKAIAAGTHYYEGNIVDLYTDFAARPEKFLPVGAVVTIPATASEANEMAVLTDSKTGRKILKPFGEVKPKFAILNPALTTSVSRFQTASGGFDMFAHAFERYFDLRRGSSVFDVMSTALMKEILRQIPIVLEDPENLDARGQLMLAATIAHSDMIGPGGDFACHTMSHFITEEFHLAHGAALALVFPAWCEYIWEKGLDEEKTARMVNFFAEVFDECDVPSGIAKLKSYIETIGLELELKTEKKDFMEMATTSCIGLPAIGDGFVKLTPEDVANIYKKFMK